MRKTDAILAELRTLRGEMTTHFDALGSRVDAQGGRIDGLHTRLDTLIDAVADLRVDLRTHTHDD